MSWYGNTWYHQPAPHPKGRGKNYYYWNSNTWTADDADKSTSVNDPTATAATSSAVAAGQGAAGASAGGSLLAASGSSALGAVDGSLAGTSLTGNLSLNLSTAATTSGGSSGAASAAAASSTRPGNGASRALSAHGSGPGGALATSGVVGAPSAGTTSSAASAGANGATSGTGTALAQHQLLASGSAAGGPALSTAAQTTLGPAAGSITTAAAKHATTPNNRFASGNHTLNLVSNHETAEFWHRKQLGWGSTHPNASVPFRIPDKDYKATLTDVHNMIGRVLCPDVYGRFSTMDAKQEIPWIEIPNAHKIPRITVCLLPSLGYQAAQRKAEMAPKDGSPVKDDALELRRRFPGRTHYMPFLMSLFSRPWRCHVSLRRGFFPEKNELLRDFLMAKLRVCREAKMTILKPPPSQRFGMVRDRSNCLYPNNSFLVTRDELSLAGYPLLCQHNVIGLQDHLEPGWACAEKKTPEDLIPNICDILTIDCEMVTTTTEENALARLSAVNWSGHTLLDIYVKPPHPVTDYKTKFSGITVSDLMNVTRTQADAQRLLLQFLKPRTVLAGHSLENDLHALKVVHPFIMDTTVLYPHPDRLPMKLGLQRLVERYLKRKMDRDKGHSSVDDALCTLHLVQLKIQHGINGSAFLHQDYEQQRGLGTLPGVRTKLYAEQEALPPRVQWCGRVGEHMMVGIENALESSSRKRPNSVPAVSAAAAALTKAVAAGAVAPTVSGQVAGTTPSAPVAQVGEQVAPTSTASSGGGAAVATTATASSSSSSGNSSSSSSSTAGTAAAAGAAAAVVGVAATTATVGAAKDKDKERNPPEETADGGEAVSGAKRRKVEVEDKGMKVDSPDKMQVDEESGVPPSRVGLTGTVEGVSPKITVVPPSEQFNNKEPVTIAPVVAEQQSNTNVSGAAGGAGASASAAVSHYIPSGGEESEANYPISSSPPENSSVGLGAMSSPGATPDDTSESGSPGGADGLATEESDNEDEGNKEGKKTAAGSTTPRAVPGEVKTPTAGGAANTTAVSTSTTTTTTAAPAVPVAPPPPAAAAGNGAPPSVPSATSAKCHWPSVSAPSTKVTTRPPSIPNPSGASMATTAHHQRRDSAVSSATGGAPGQLMLGSSSAAAREMSHTPLLEAAERDHAARLHAQRVAAQTAAEKAAAAAGPGAKGAAVPSSSAGGLAGGGSATAATAVIPNGATASSGTTLAGATATATPSAGNGGPPPPPTAPVHPYTQENLRIFNFARLEKDLSRPEENVACMDLDLELYQLMQKTGQKNELFVFLSSGKPNLYSKTVKARQKDAEGSGNRGKWEKLIEQLPKTRDAVNTSGFLAMTLHKVDEDFLPPFPHYKNMV